MPPGVLDGVKPYLDHYEAIDGVDYRRNVFIFLSNTGGNTTTPAPEALPPSGKEITEAALSTWRAGGQREEISLTDLEPLIASGAFNEEGGLRHRCLLPLPLTLLPAVEL